ncbi:MAG: MBL fold metallo-hydrolase [Dehalococcoidia bacterium]
MMVIVQAAVSQVAESGAADSEMLVNLKFELVRTAGRSSSTGSHAMTSSGQRSYTVGNLKLQIISDGTFLQDAGAVFGIVPKVMWERIAIEVNEKNQMTLGLNCLLVRSGGRTMLIETGMGNKLDERRRSAIYPGDYGYLLNNLAAVGVQPTDIDVVVNTHLHLDHCGWNTVSLHGRTLPTFPRARYYVQRGEYEALLNPNERTRAAYLRENIDPLVESGQLEIVEGEHQITPELRFLPAPGHTQDHACVVITSGRETAIYTGDLVHHAVQLERPAWIPAMDTLPLVSLETKKRLTEQMLRENALVIVAHASFPGTGHLSEVGGRNAWISA